MQSLAIHLGTALLALITGKLAWLAFHIGDDSQYLVSKWAVVAFAAGLTAAFAWKPYWLRWAVAPYFVLTALAALPKLLSQPMGMLVAVSLVVVMTQLVVGVSLLLLKRNTGKGAEAAAKPEVTACR